MRLTQQRLVATSSAIELRILLFDGELGVMRVLRFAASSSVARQPSLPHNAALRVPPYRIRRRARIKADLWDGEDRGRSDATDRRPVFADNSAYRPDLATDRGSGRPADEHSCPLPVSDIAYSRRQIFSALCPDLVVVSRPTMRRRRSGVASRASESGLDVRQGMQEGNYDVLLLRPHEITDVIDIGKAIDLVEQGYREAQDFPLINAPRRRVHSHRNVRISSFPGGVDGLGVIGSLTRGESVTFDTAEQDYPYREHPVYLLWNSQTAVLQCIMIGEIAERHVGFQA